MSQNNSDINNVIQYAQIVGQLGPEGQTVLKIGAIADYIADKLGIPVELKNSEQERAMIIQQTQQLAEQAAQAQQPPVEEEV
jgi:phosphopentomutase